jgi:hypothetical protein
MTFKIKPPPYSSEQVVKQAERLIEDFRAIVGRSWLLHHGLRFDDVYEQVIYPKYEIELDETKDLGFDEAGKKILGAFDVSNNVAFIDVCLKGDPRRVFTQWHEVGGHGVLQGQWLRDQLPRSGRRIITTEASLSANAISVLERQANLYASHAAAPSWFVDAVIGKVFRPTKPFLFFGPCRYWFEVNGIKSGYVAAAFEDLCQLIAWKIQPLFGRLSKEALSYRVKDSSWLVNKSTPSTRLYRTSKPWAAFDAIPAIAN